MKKVKRIALAATGAFAMVSAAAIIVSGHYLANHAVGSWLCSISTGLSTILLCWIFNHKGWFEHRRISGLAFRTKVAFVTLFSGVVWMNCAPIVAAYAHLDQYPGTVGLWLILVTMSGALCIALAVIAEPRRNARQDPRLRKHVRQELEDL